MHPMGGSQKSLTDVLDTLTQHHLVKDLATRHADKRLVHLGLVRARKGLDMAPVLGGRVESRAGSIADLPAVMICLSAHCHHQAKVVSGYLRRSRRGLAPRRRRRLPGRLNGLDSRRLGEAPRLAAQRPDGPRGLASPEHRVVLSSVSGVCLSPGEEAGRPDANCSRQARNVAEKGRYLNPKGQKVLSSSQKSACMDIICPHNSHKGRRGTESRDRKSEKNTPDATGHALWGTKSQGPPLSLLPRSCL